MAWTISYHEAAKVEADAQPVDVRARLERMTDIVAEHGLEQLPRSVAKHIRGELWELRLSGRDGIARALYVTRAGQRLVILRVFTKKTRKTPAREIRMALDRAKEIG